MKKPTIKPLTGNELRKIRQKLGMSYRVFAKYIDVSEGCLKGWEWDKNEVPISYRVTKMLTKHTSKPTKIKSRYYENDDILDGEIDD